MPLLRQQLQQNEVQRVQLSQQLRRSQKTIARLLKASPSSGTANGGEGRQDRMDHKVWEGARMGKVGAAASALTIGGYNDSEFGDEACSSFSGGSSKRTPQFKVCPILAVRSAPDFS